MNIMSLELVLGQRAIIPTIITNHKPKIRSIGSFLVSSIDFEWTHYCSKWANFRLFLYIKCLQVHELKVV